MRVAADFKLDVHLGISKSLRPLYWAWLIGVAVLLTAAPGLAADIKLRLTVSSVDDEVVVIVGNYGANAAGSVDVFVELAGILARIKMPAVQLLAPLDLETKSYF